MQEGTIIGFRGSWNSGIAHLIIQKEDGTIEHIPCDNAPTVRALDSAFENVINANHTVNQNAIKGKKIRYSVDIVLEGFTPLEE